MKSNPLSFLFTLAVTIMSCCSLRSGHSQTVVERIQVPPGSGDAGGKVLVKADKKLYALPFQEILFIEGQGDYIRIHTSQLKLMVHDTLKRFLESLPAGDFMRIHKSYVIHLKHIKFIEGNQLTIGEQSLPVSPAQRDELLKRFSSL